MHEAHYYKNNGQGVTCLLCPKTCSIAEGETGFCRTRQNSGGKLYVLNYAACSACALDPIEKKPLYHFYPGRQILSLGTWGCNFSCQFCQNWRIAHEQPETKTLSPQAAVGMAQEAGSGNIGLAFTYSEPGVWYEYVLDTARLAHEKGLKNVLVTNGFINKQPLRKLLPYIDAMNIDVKAFSDEYYQQVCAGRLDNVKHTVEMASLYCHVEITTLLVPGLNDSKDEIKALAKWLNGVDSTIPCMFPGIFLITAWLCRQHRLQHWNMHTKLPRDNAPAAENRREAPHMKVSIIGATGYTGEELLRLLSSHPQAEIVAITSEARLVQPYPKYTLICKSFMIISW
ncbi:hypothetical protein Lal_00003804 [Lupinus albus]|nr:hypothetical protein Lal_00003804 [Lupinus albus]